MGNKKILVTGDAGFIGRHATRQFGETGKDVIAPDELSTASESAATPGADRTQRQIA